MDPKARKKKSELFYDGICELHVLNSCVIWRKNSATIWRKNSTPIRLHDAFPILDSSSTGYTFLCSNLY